MEGNTIRTIMTGLENFDFSLREYVRDGGVSVAKRAAEHSGIAYSLAEDVDTGLHFILRSRFLAKVEAETERVTFTSMGQKYILTYATEDGLLDGLAIITPKKVCVRLGKGCQSVQKTARLLDYSPRIYTVFPSLGSPANEKGVKCAKRLFIQMYHERAV